MWRHDGKWIGLGCAAWMLLSMAGGVGAEIEVGKKLPSLSSYELEGRVPSTAGKVVLLDFWASWCGPCKQSFPTMNELQATYGKRGFVILAVSVDDDAKAMAKFLEKNAARFSVVRDPGKKLASASGAQTMPTSFLIGRDGVVRHRHSGFHGEKTKKQYAAEIEALLAK